MGDVRWFTDAKVLCVAATTVPRKYGDGSFGSEPEIVAATSGGHRAAASVQRLGRKGERRRVFGQCADAWGLLDGSCVGEHAGPERQAWVVGAAVFVISRRGRSAERDLNGSLEVG
jgi:hypothetical protein